MGSTIVTTEKHTNNKQKIEKTETGEKIHGNRGRQIIADQLGKGQKLSSRLCFSFHLKKQAQNSAVARLRVQVLGFRVQCSRFRVWCLRGYVLGFTHTHIKVQVLGLGFTAQGLGFRASGVLVRIRIYGLGFRVQGLGFRIGFRVLGFRVQGSHTHTHTHTHLDGIWQVGPVPRALTHIHTHTQTHTPGHIPYGM